VGIPPKTNYHLKVPTPPNIKTLRPHSDTGRQTTTKKLLQLENLLLHTLVRIYLWDNAFGDFLGSGVTKEVPDSVDLEREENCKSKCIWMEGQSRTDHGLQGKQF
jgi:hypothetical protein